MATQNQTVQKILIAPDKFKGSLTSTQAAEAIRRGIEEKFLLPDSLCKPEFRIIEIADGGDGSLEVLQGKLTGSQVVPVRVHDPLGREVASQILIYRMPRVQITPVLCPDAEKTPVQAQKASVSCTEVENSLMRAQNAHDMCPDEGQSEEICAFIEMAKISGLEMLSKEERNSLHTSTFGMGEAIKAAIAHGATQITLSIGGSATNDGGAGMLQALGYRFFDEQGAEIPVPICGGDLQRVAEILAPDFPDRMEECKNSAMSVDGDGVNDVGGEGFSVNILSGIIFKVICDVTNPLLGPQGATAVYGPQKGADANALRQLEAGLSNYAAVAEKCIGVQPAQKEHPGAGAAGGVGYAGLAFLGAELIPGWKFFAQITSLEESVQWADLIITGEGSLDSQSLSGKVVSGVLNLAAKYNKEVIIFCGVSKLTPAELENAAAALPQGLACYSIASLGYPLEVCMRDAASLLQRLARGSRL